MVWCTDVFGIIADLQGAVDECARVLAPGGYLISYVTLATDRIALFEQAELDRSQGCVASSMNRENLERCFAEHFDVERRIVVGGQHRQNAIEAGDDETLQNLVRASRLMTWPDRYRKVHGDVAYGAALTETFWGIYQLLGKLTPTAYLLRRKPWEHTPVE